MIETNEIGIEFEVSEKQRFGFTVIARFVKWRTLTRAGSEGRYIVYYDSGT